MLFRRIRRWWHLRDPEVRWVVEVGVKEVPEEASPVPEVLPHPYEFISRYVTENSYLLDDPHTVLGILRGSEADKPLRYTLKLKGLGGIRLFLSRPEIVADPYLVLMESDDLSLWLLTYHGVVTAARLELVDGRVLYGLRVFTEYLRGFEGEVSVAATRLRKSFYDWGPEFSVYIKGLDRQHNYLVTTLNNLYRHLIAGSSREVIDDTLSALVDYTKFHFRSEEILFDKYGYPRAEGHRKQHKSFVDKVAEFMEEYKAGEQRLSVEVLNFLADWVYNHILISDHDYGEWFLEKHLPIVEEELAKESREARRKLGLDKRLE